MSLTNLRWKCPTLESNFKQINRHTEKSPNNSKHTKSVWKNPNKYGTHSSMLWFQKCLNFRNRTNSFWVLRAHIFLVHTLQLYIDCCFPLASDAPLTLTWLWRSSGWSRSCSSWMGWEAPIKEFNVEKVHGRISDSTNPYSNHFATFAGEREDSNHFLMIRIILWFAHFQLHSLIWQIKNENLPKWCQTGT